MFKDKVISTFIVILVFLIWGCGTMAKEDDKISVPQKISIEMPKALRVNDKKSKSYLKKEDNKSSAYLELKGDVKFLEEKRVELELNLLFINEVIEQIDIGCKNIALEKICRFKESKLSFIFDENLSKAVLELTHIKSDYEIGYEVLFGEVELVKYGNNALYQYRLKMDTTFGDLLIKSSETISWSRDKNKILSYYIEESQQNKREIRIKFEEEERKRKQIVVEDNFVNKIEKSSEAFYLKMVKEFDVNETYTLNSRSLSIDSDLVENRFSSLGLLSNIKGYLLFEGVFETETFKERERFDGDGRLIGSTYCWSDMNCDLEDEGSWLSF